MPETIIPFAQNGSDDKKSASNGNFLSRFPQAIQEAAKEKSFVADYLQLIPIDEIGVPAYYPKLSKDLKKLQPRNLIYPIGEGLLVHICPDANNERDFWIPIEPHTVLSLTDMMQKLESKFLNMAEEIGRAEEVQRRQVFLDAVDKICTVGPGENNGKLHVTPQELEGIKYLTIRNKLGLGVLQPLLLDPNIEDISGSGLGFVFIEHRVFGSLKTTVHFATLDELDDFVIWLGERIKRPVTLRHPIVDATLPDGSRINIVYGRDITKRGSNFTIRKFTDDPLSILKLIGYGTLNYMMAAYLWLAIEEGMNVFVVGATASGKTTLLNAVTTFMPANAKIVSIEDTPELQIPHQNWLREVVRQTGQGEKDAAVGMFDLLKAALRQRPDRIIIGEIRGVEGNIAFQAMQTGHGVMATFHASTVQRLIQRLTGDPINVPKPNVDSLDLVVIQAAVRGPDGATVRRVTSINEIVSYDPTDNNYAFLTAFRWRAEDDTFEFPGDMSSYLLEQRIAPKLGIPQSKKRMVYTMLKKRAAILEKLHKSGGVDGFAQLFQVMAEAKKQGLV